MERDVQLDIYRGLAMIYIVCVIHLLYWFDFGSEPLLSCLLFEMPVIFFITGASYSLGSRQRTLGAMMWSRFKRVMVPYYVYALVMVLLVAVGYVVVRRLGFLYRPLVGADIAAHYTFDITSYTWSDVLDILLAQDIAESPFVLHLWFIMVYMVLSCTFPLQQKLMQRCGHPWVYAVGSLVLFAAVSQLTELPFVRNVFCYNVFLVIGYLFYRRLPVRLVCVAALCAGGALWWLVDDGFTRMQDHKFPPDLLFLCFGLLALSVLALVFSYLKLPRTRIVELWNQRGFNIYLYQSVVFFVAYIFKGHLVHHVHSHALQCALCLALVFVLSTLLSFVTSPLERRVLRRLP